MKRVLAVMLSLVCILSLAGCSKDLEVTRNSVYVLEDGTVTSFEVGTLEQSYYSVDELTSFVNDSIDDYNASNGTSVVADSVTEEDGVVTIKVTYPSALDYVKINDATLFEGTVAEAKAAGYNLDTDYYVYNKGLLRKNGTLNKEPFTADDENYIVVASVGTDVIIDGKVLAVSSVDSAIPHIGDDGDRAGYDDTNISSSSFFVIYKR